MEIGGCQVQAEWWVLPNHIQESLHLAPSYFHVFGPTKTPLLLRSKKFDSHSALKWAMRRWLYSDPTEFLRDQDFQTDPLFGQMPQHAWKLCEK